MKNKYKFISIITILMMFLLAVQLVSATVDDGTCNSGDATITAPVESAHLGGTITVSWTFNGNDCNGTDPTTLHALASNNAGDDWTDVGTAASETATSLTFASSSLSDDTDYSFRLYADPKVVDTTSYSDVTIDDTKPSISSITITDSTHVDVVFSENVDFVNTHGNTAGATDFSGTLVGAVEATTGSISDDTLTLTFGSSIGTIAIIAGASGFDLNAIIEDESTTANVLDAVTNQALSDEAAPTISSITITSSTTADVVFTEAVNFVGDGTDTAIAADYETVYIGDIQATAGAISSSTATFTFGSSIGTIAIDAGVSGFGLGAVIKDEATTPNTIIAVTNQALTDGAGPEILTAVADDGADPGTGVDGDEALDRVIITFSENTAKPTIVAGSATIGGTDIDTVLAVTAHTWKHSGAIDETSAWNANGNILTIVLDGGDPTIVPTDSIVLDNTIKDAGTNSVDDDHDDKIITGSFDDATAPTLSSATLDSSTQVTLVWDENVAFQTSKADTLTKITLKGANPTDASISTTDVTLTFAAGADLGTITITDNADDLEIAASAFTDTSTATNNNTIVENQDVTDGAGPEILTAIAADVAGDDGVGAGDTVTITWSETTNAATIDKDNISTVLALTAHSWLDGAAAIGSATWSESDTILTVTLSTGTSIPTIIVTDIITPSTAIKDDEGSANDAPATAKTITGDFDDATAPTLSTAKVTGANTITLTFSEAVVTTDADYSDLTLTIGGERSVTNVAGSTTDTITLTFDGTAVGTDETGTIDIAVTLTDIATNPISALDDQAITDSQLPTFTAVRTALNTIVLTFSENVDASDTATAAWTVADATVTVVTDPDSSTSLTITTTGLTSTSSTPAVTYVAAEGTVVDVTEANEVANSATANAADQVAPTVSTAKVTGANEFTIVFSESVTASAGDFTLLTGGMSSQTVDSITSGSGTATIVVATTGTAVGTDATGGVTIGVGVKDISATTNAFSAGTQALTDGQVPTFTAARTALNTIVLTFSENVDASDTATAAWTVADATVDEVTDPANSTSLTITTTGLTSTSSTPAVTYVAAEGTVVDVTEANEVANSATADAADQVAPTVSTATYNANTTVMVVTFSEAMDVSTVDLSRIQFHAATPEESFPLTGASAVVDDLVTLTLTLTNDQDEDMTGIGVDPKITVSAGAIKDLVSNNNTVASGTDLVLDSTAPTLSATGHSYTYATNELTLSFSKSMDASETNVSKIKIASTNDGTGHPHILIGATAPTVDGKTLTITLTDAQRTAIDGWNVNNLYVTFEAEAFSDMTTEPIEAITTGVEIDTYIEKDQIALSSGWNLISVPYQMDDSNNNFTELLEGYDPTVYIYTGSAWDQRSDIKPLYGYLVNVNHSGVVDLSPYKSQTGIYPLDDADRYLNANKWYTIGASTRTSETASSVFNSTSYRNLAFMEEDGNYDDDGVTNLIFGKGYWVHTGTSPINIIENLART